MTFSSVVAVLGSLDLDVGDTLSGAVEPAAQTGTALSTLLTVLNFSTLLI